MRPGRTLLVVSAGAEAVTGIKLAKSMGLHVVASDGNPGAPGFGVADDRIIASTYDVERTIAEARRYHEQVRRLDGVMCIASDVPLTVASVAKALGLPGIPVESARLSQDKLAMKDKFAADGVPVPWYQGVTSVEELLKVVVDRGLPLVVKPVDSRGARGVSRLLPGVDPAWAFAEAKRFSPSGRVIVEKFLAGPQLSTESLVLDGIAYTPGFSDRNYERIDDFGPHIIEDGGDLPTSLPREIRAEVERVVEAAARSMGITRGIVKGDIVVSDGKVYVIEMAARLSGGYFCTHQIPRSTGVDLLGAAIRVALGESVNPQALQVKAEKPVCQRWLFPPAGKVVSVEGVDEASRMPGVFHLEVRVSPGDEMKPIDSHPARAGMVMTEGATREEAQQRARAALDRIKIVTTT